MNKRIKELASELTNLCHKEDVALVLSVKDGPKSQIGIAGTPSEVGKCLLALDVSIEKQFILDPHKLRMMAAKDGLLESSAGDLLKTIFETLSDDCDCPGCKARREESDDEDIDFSELTDVVADLCKNIFGDKEGE